MPRVQHLWFSLLDRACPGFRVSDVKSLIFRSMQAKQSAVDQEGWFSTGDVASIDPLGFMRITDRMKDVIKSGGEWISSIEVENAAMSHKQVMCCTTA